MGGTRGLLLQGSEGWVWRGVVESNQEGVGCCKL